MWASFCLDGIIHRSDWSFYRKVETALELTSHAIRQTERHRLSVSVAAVAVILVSCCVLCATAEDEADSRALPPAGFEPDWKPIFAGVDLAEVRLKDPPLAVYAVRVDLDAQGVQFFVTPPNGDRPEETDGQTASDFLREHGLQVAVNASPFSPVNSIDGSPRDVKGLSMSNGQQYSDPAKRYGAMLISKDNRVRFDTPPIDTTDAYNAVGGFGMLLVDGENKGSDGRRHPRTVAGLSANGRKLYLIVIDGRQLDYSVGATTAEAAEWARALGASNALNLDGGGSTTLVVQSETDSPRIVNRPIHGHLPGNERVNGNNLGIRAKPLEHGGDKNGNAHP